MPLPQYGAREGLADRLIDWTERLARDKSFPWTGTGLLADLKAAAEMISGKPAKSEPQEEGKTWEEWETQFTKTQEYDL